MADDFVIAIEGLEVSKLLDAAPAKIERAAYMALNRAADRARTRMAARVLDQVALPARYLGPAAKRLYVSEKAKKGSLAATIIGRGEPISLARFSRDRPGRKGGVRVAVKPGGSPHVIPRAFMIQLKRGTAMGGNQGLAVRTDGAPPPGAYKPKEIGRNLWLLYGPSLDQVLYSLRNNGGVVNEVTPEVLQFLDAEFLRLMNVEFQ